MAAQSGSQTIVAVTGEDDRYDAIRTRASEIAAGAGGTVILYDIDAAGVFASPVPTEWSGEAGLVECGPWITSPPARRNRCAWGPSYLGPGNRSVTRSTGHTVLHTLHLRHSSAENETGWSS